MPTGSNLVVRTGDGSIRVEHVNGRVELRSADGSVTGRDLIGDIVAHTEDGAIRLEGVDGKCDVASDDGSIAVQGRLDGLRVSAEDGSVVVRASAGSKMIRDWSLSTGDGSMTLFLADGIGAELDAQANDGSVKLDSGLSFERWPAPINRARRCAAGSAPVVRVWCCAAATAPSACAASPAARCPRHPPCRRSRRWLPPISPSNAERAQRGDAAA